MKPIAAAPNLADQVRDAILSDIASGQLLPGDRIIQEKIAQALGVSRQPVQQALNLLHNQGVLQEAPGRGLIVTVLDTEHVLHMYDLRAAIEGLACRRAAEKKSENNAEKLGKALIETGRKAVASGSVAKMIAADMKFHELLYTLSGNPLVAPSLSSHLTYTQRVMGEVLLRDEKPRDIWNQHAKILDAIVKGDADAAEVLVKSHITQAANFMVVRLRASAKKVNGRNTRV
jgi:DNA-binding GntR family transcriptional regulator